MSVHFRAPGSAQAIAFTVALALALGSAGQAAAKTKAKKPHWGNPAAVAVAIPALPEPVRFFTISQVLAKHDGIAAAGPYQLAAAESRSDVAVPAQSTEPFDLMTFRAPEGLLWTKWRGVAAAIAGEADLIAGCRAVPATCYSAPTLRYIALVDAAAARSGRDRLDWVNRQVNMAIRYTSDLAQHGVADRWSSPLASLASARGDCEDYAIAKYAALRAAGMAAGDLRIVLVRDTATGEDHAIVAARDDGRWLVLDNRRMALLEGADVRPLRPLFAIDDQGVKLFAAPYADADADAGDADRDIAPATADWGVMATSGGAALPLLM